MRPTNPKLIPRPYICVNIGLKSIVRRPSPGGTSESRSPVRSAGLDVERQVRPEDGTMIRSQPTRSGEVIHNLRSLTLQSLKPGFGPRLMNNFGLPIRDDRLSARVHQVIEFPRARPRGYLESHLRRSDPAFLNQTLAPVQNL
jgi:hypothetical protein